MQFIVCELLAQNPRFQCENLEDPREPKDEMLPCRKGVTPEEKTQSVHRPTFGRKADMNDEKNHGDEKREEKPEKDGLDGLEGVEGLDGVGVGVVVVAVSALAAMISAASTEL
jgi:hypothetical protein